ncbi:putative sulfate exporter family transporter [Polaromonas sp. P1(28)-13]|nr:putative sulfate exporter family transporter [Polaromonas sp. P2-4]UUZ75037.1 putative sulfate exporter family transporter [Polaromonas sp. P1(28)-13]
MQALKAQSARWFPGVLVSAVVAVAAMFLAEHYGAPVMLFALLLGMALNFLSQEGRCAPGVDFTAKQVLRLGVALLGLRITAGQVMALGWQPVLMVALAVVLTIVCGIVLARLMGFQMFFGLLTGGAVAICGASAALALSAAMPQQSQEPRTRRTPRQATCMCLPAAARR